MTQSSHQPYTQQEHWKDFWQMFYHRKKQHQIIEISLTDNMLKEAEVFCKKIIKAKMEEEVHQKDSDHEWKRWMTGVLGEMALEKFLGVSFRDTTIGHSKNYAIPDLAPLNLKVGVKSFRVGNFPLVNRSTYNLSPSKRKKMDGQVFIGVDPNRKKAYLFGLAFEKELYHNEDNLKNNRYVKDGNALERKVAFTEMHSLYTFHTLSELQTLAQQHNRLLAS